MLKLLVVAIKGTEVSGTKKLSRAAVVGFMLLVLVLFLLPPFFNAIERRPGVVLHDQLLGIFPAYDVSAYIFVIIWGVGLLVLIRSIQNPDILTQFIWTYLFICLSRVLTISLVPLAPPVGLVPLHDPLTGIFYAEHSITRDLFYSGHTATLFVFYLCLQKPVDKWLALILMMILVVLLLIQHVHYTIDIIAAPVVVYPIYKVVEQKLAAQPK